MPTPRFTSALARRCCLLFAILISGLAVCAQTNIGSTTAANPDAVLEITAANKGLLMPRIALSATTSPAPLTAFVAGMQIYNTATAGDVTPGIYYSDGAKWVRILSATPNNGAWLKSGNSGTNPAANYIGTADAADLSIRTNATEQMHIATNGNIGIGIGTPLVKLHVNGGVIITNLPHGSGNDSVVTVNPFTGMLQSVSADEISHVRKIIYTAAQGQQNFTTPGSITNIDKISLYRNGVLINCTVAGANVVTAEVACEVGDDIKIIQQF